MPQRNISFYEHNYWFHFLINAEYYVCHKLWDTNYIEDLIKKICIIFRIGYNQRTMEIVNKWTWLYKLFQVSSISEVNHNQSAKKKQEQCLKTDSDNIFSNRCLKPTCILHALSGIQRASTQTHIDTHAHTGIHTHIYICVCVSMCVSVCGRVCTCAFLWSNSMDITYQTCF